MSGVTAVDPISLDNAPRRNATIALSEEPSDQPETTGGSADEPAVIVSLSTEATTAMPTPDNARAGPRRGRPCAILGGRGKRVCRQRRVQGPTPMSPPMAIMDRARCGSRPHELRRRRAQRRQGHRRRRQSVRGPLPCGEPRDRSCAPSTSTPPGTMRRPERPASARSPLPTVARSISIVPVADLLPVGTEDEEAWKTWQRATPGDAPDAGMATASGLQALAPLAAEQEMPGDEPPPRIDVSA